MWSPSGAEVAAYLMRLERCDGKVESMILLIFLISWTLFFFFWCCAGQMRFQANRASLQPVRRIKAPLWMDVLLSLWTFLACTFSFLKSDQVIILWGTVFSYVFFCTWVFVLCTWLYIGMCMYSFWKNISGIFPVFSTWILDMPQLMGGKTLWEFKLFPDPYGHVVTTHLHISAYNSHNHLIPMHLHWVQV